MRKIKKYLSALIIFSLLLQSNGGAFLLARQVRAEDLTPTPEITAVPTPPEATPTLETTPEPTVEPTAEPTIEITPTVEVIPTTEPATTTPEPAKEEPQPTEATITPTIEIKQPEIQGHLETFILSEEQTNDTSLDLDAQEAIESASLTTDKPDYAPTEVVLIAGTDFIPGQTYTIVISSQDPPPVHFEAQITAESDGTFFYVYQLDGTYRPNYKVEAKDASGTVIATTTFTDTSKPDLVVAKSNNVSGSVSLSDVFTWKIRVTNSGTAIAIFDKDERILVDNLPSSGATYGSPSVVTSGTTGSGSIGCVLGSNNLICTAYG